MKKTRRKFTLELCQEEAIKRNGACLSDFYKDQYVHMNWQCQYGHTWNANFSNIIHKNFWCPHCAGNARTTIEWFHEYAKSKNGMCLSTEYKNQRTKIKMQCNKNHIWITSAQSLKSEKTWCPTCYGIGATTIEDCKILASKKNGKCLSTEYKNCKTKLQWECNKGHKWLATANTIRKGHWCNTCADPFRASKRNDSQIKYHWKTNQELICVGSYEVFVVNYLNQHKIDYEWQAHRLITPFDNPSGSKSTYTPDVYLTKEDKYIEIKGQFMGDALLKWLWLKKEYPTSELWDYKKLRSIGYTKQQFS